VEFVAHGTDIGVHLRYASSADGGSGRAANALRYLDGRVNLGSTHFSVEVGYVLRTEKFASADTSVGLARAGFRANYHVGTKGLVIGWAASYMRQLKADTGAMKGEGIEAETSVLYVAPRLPFYVQLGYRREIMQFKSDTEPMRPEEMSMLFFGVGVHRGIR
jgi:hypothetical protein